jgi:hypothetical protein
MNLCFVEAPMLKAPEVTIDPVVMAQWAKELDAAQSTVLPDDTEDSL